MIRWIGAWIALVAVAGGVFFASAFLTGRVGAGDFQGYGPVPNIAAEATDGSLELGYKGRGGGTHKAYGRGDLGPDRLEITEAGTLEAEWYRFFYAHPERLILYWNGEEIGTIHVDEYVETSDNVYKVYDDDRTPKLLDRLPAGKGFEYDITVTLFVDATFDVDITIEHRKFYCGKVGGVDHYCYQGNWSSYFSAECYAASQDPAYLELYRPLSGPECVAEHIEVD